MRLAVSLCNLRSDAPGGILLFDSVTKEAASAGIDLGAISSVTGLTLYGDILLAAYISENVSHVAFLDARSLEILAKVALPDALDIHSIASRGDKLYVASTGSDSVLRYALGDLDLQLEGTHWSPASGDDDTIHINGMTTHEGRLLCSGFGKREGERWASASNGFVFDLDSSETVMTGIYHPHSVTLMDGQLYVLESVTGRLVASERSLWSIDGYARGLCFLAPGVAAIGSSVARHTNVQGFQNTADPGDPIGICALTIVEMATGSRTVVSLGEYNNELYDIVALP